MMQTSFVHLRVSSEFSISRGLLRINEIIENAQKLKMPAVALTDLNNMYLETGECDVVCLEENSSWFDSGTFDSLLKASNFVKNYEKLY